MTLRRWIVLSASGSGASGAATERLDLKHELYAQIEPVLGDATVVASSASGLTLSELRAGWHHPARLVLGHPFNPPHLIPLVEVMGNHRTAPGVIAWTRGFYESIGKVTIELKREVPGTSPTDSRPHSGEKPSTSSEGVATAQDIDTAVSSGPGPGMEPSMELAGLRRRSWRGETSSATAPSKRLVAG